MTEETTELELVSNNADVKPAKKVTKKKVAKKVAPKRFEHCEDCKSSPICSQMKRCKRAK